MHDKLMRWVVLGLSAIMLCGVAPIAGAETVDPMYAAAKQEGEVNWYTGLLQDQIVRPLVAGFEAKYPGIRVYVTGGGDTDLLVKITAEVRAHQLQADVTDGPSMAGVLIQDGLAAPYFPPNGVNVPAQDKDPHGLWTAPTVFFLGTVINTDLVKPSEEPKTLQDLLDPKWKGKMAWSGEVSTAGPAGLIGGILDMLGQAPGKAYLRQLAAQRIATIPSNPRVVLNQVIAGKYTIGLATYNHHAYASQAAGAAVKWLPIAPVVASMARSMLLKGAPHPEAAKLLINYLLSRQGQEVFRNAGYIPSVATVPPKDPTLKIDPNRVRVFAPTPAQEVAGMPEWSGLFQKLFQ